MTTRRYQYGAKLDPDEHYYIRRKADDDLLRWCLEREYSYVFNASQTGKSSLIERTSRELNSRGIETAQIDLQDLGSPPDADSWYHSFAHMIAREWALHTDLEVWWAANGTLTPTYRWIMFFEQVVLAEIKEPIVIFIDEADRTADLAFRADIYGALRSLRNARPTRPILNRLTFVLAGLAAPRELIGNASNTGDNIWKGVALGDLTEKEGAVEELAEGLGLETSEQRKQTLRWILGWSSGHPYLTQKLCARVQKQEWKESSTEKVDELVEVEFLNEPNETNLSYVERELTKERENGVSRTAVLVEYERVLSDGRVLDTNTAAQVELKQTGIVKVADGWLQVRNRIYQQFFDRQWLRWHFRPSLREWWAVTPKRVKQWMYIAASLGIGLVWMYTAVSLGMGLVGLFVTMVVLVIGLALTLNFARGQLQLADKAAHLARDQQQISTKVAQLTRIRDLAAKSYSVKARPDLRLLLAIEALRVTQDVGEPPVVEAEQALRDALAGPTSTPLRTVSHVSGLAASPDGRWLAAAGTDQAVRVWNLTNLSAEPAVLRAGGMSLAFSPDGRWLATSGYTTVLWDMTNLNTEPVALRGHKNHIEVLAFSPNGHWLAAGSAEGTAQLWDLTYPNAAPTVLAEYGATVFSKLRLAFSPDGRWLVIRSGGGAPQLCDMTNPSTEPILLTGDYKFFFDFDFSPDGHWLAMANGDATRLWDMTNLSAEPVMLLDTAMLLNSGSVISLAFSPDGRWLATGSLDNTTRLWNMAHRSLEPMVLGGQGRPILNLAFSPDGRWLATGSHDKTVQLWRMDDLTVEPMVLRGHKDPSSSLVLVFSPDGRWLATSEGVLDMEDLSAESVVLGGRKGWIRSLAFSPDGRWLATGNYDARVRVWDMFHQNPEPVVLAGHKGWIRSLAFSPDGRWLATGSEDATARMWDIADLSAEPVILGWPKGSIRSLVFSPDGRWLAGAGAHEAVRIWNMTNLSAEPGVLPEGGESLVFSPDGRWLATSGYITARVWDMTDLSSTPIVHRLEGGGPRVWIRSLAFSPDGRWLATESSDAAVLLLWDLNNLSADPVLLRGHDDWITTLAFSLDGHWLATGSQDLTARVWDMTNLSSTPVVLRHEGWNDGWITTLAFSPDGRWLVTNGAGTLQIWDMDLEHLIERACRLTGRNFMKSEWS